MLCDSCHHRLTYGDAFYELELNQRREREGAERDRAVHEVKKRRPSLRLCRLNRAKLVELAMASTRARAMDLSESFDDVPF